MADKDPTIDERARHIALKHGVANCADCVPSIEAEAYRNMVDLVNLTYKDASETLAKELMAMNGKIDPARLLGCIEARRARAAKLLQERWPEVFAGGV